MKKPTLDDIKIWLDAYQYRSEADATTITGRCGNRVYLNIGEAIMAISNAQDTIRVLKKDVETRMYGQQPSDEWMQDLIGKIVGRTDEYGQKIWDRAYRQGQIDKEAELAAKGEPVAWKWFEGRLKECGILITQQDRDEFEQQFPHVTFEPLYAAPLPAEQVKETKKMSKPYPALCKDCQHAELEKGIGWSLLCHHPTVNARDSWTLACGEGYGSSCRKEREKGFFSACGVRGRLWTAKENGK